MPVSRGAPPISSGGASSTWALKLVGWQLIDEAFGIGSTTS
jgi:hypothetical protein